MRLLPWLALACLIPLPFAVGDEPPTRYEVVTPKPDGIIATGLNDRGDLVGFEWREDPQHPGVIGQDPFYARGGRQIWLPLLPTYTSTFPAAVSDAGLVVGRASKPGTTRFRVPLQNQAFAWTEADGIRGLGTFPGDFASFASGISRDGATICGASVGDGQVRPCVWDRVDAGTDATWRVTALPQVERLASTIVAISDDGKHVAGLDGTTPTHWSRPSRAADAAWARETIGTSTAIHPRGVNDAGTVAGTAHPHDGSTHAVTWTRADGIRPIPEPAGYARSEANAINNAGAVVGMVDGPHGSPLPPRAFVCEAGRFRLLDEGGPAFAGATALNNRGQVSGVFEADEEAQPPQRDNPVPPGP